MRTFGKSEFDTFTAVFNGHGPVMSIVPKHLDFGDVELLQDKLMSLELINDSPIPANFNAYIVNIQLFITNYFSCFLLFITNIISNRSH